MAPLQGGPNASAEEHGNAERKALYLVAAAFFLLAAYIAYEAIGSLISGEGPESSTVGLVLSISGRAGRRWRRPARTPTTISTVVRSGLVITLIRITQGTHYNWR